MGFLGKARGRTSGSDRRACLKTWLAARGYLEAYIRNTINHLAREGCVEPVDPSNPLCWVDQSFDTAATPESAYFWSLIDYAWGLEVERAGKDAVEYGMPMNDQLGLALVLAELEGKDEEDS